MKSILTLTFALFLGLPMFGQKPSECIHFEDQFARLKAPQNKIDFICFMVDSLRKQENAFRHERGADNEHIVKIVVEKSQVQDPAVGDPELFDKEGVTFLVEPTSTENEYELTLSENSFQLTETEILALLCNKFSDLYFRDHLGQENSRRGLELERWTGGWYEDFQKEKDPNGKSLSFLAMSYFEQSKYLKTLTANDILWPRDLFVNSFTLLSLQNSGYLDPHDFNPPLLKSRQYWHELKELYKPFVLAYPDGLRW